MPALMSEFVKMFNSGSSAVDKRTFFFIEGRCFLYKSRQENR